MIKSKRKPANRVGCTQWRVNSLLSAKETANFIGVICGQSDSSFTTEAIGSEIFSHIVFSSSRE